MTEESGEQIDDWGRAEHESLKARYAHASPDEIRRELHGRYRDADRMQVLRMELEARLRVQGRRVFWTGDHVDSLEKWLLDSIRREAEARE